MLHQGTCAGTGPASDVDFAACRAMACSVATITLEGQYGAGIQPANIGWRRALHDNFSADHTEGSDTLAGVSDREFEWRAVFGPERSTYVMMTGGLDLKYGFPLLHGGIYFMQQLLRRDPLVLFVKPVDKC